jgi:transposase
VDGTLLLGGDFIMAKKGSKFRSYTEEFKYNAVNKYINGNSSYETLSEEFGLRSSTQLKVWVRKYKEGVSFNDCRGKGTAKGSPFIGRPKTTFKSIEDERDYYKAQAEYLKKHYPNLNGVMKLKYRLDTR